MHEMSCGRFIVCQSMFVQESDVDTPKTKQLKAINDQIAKILQWQQQADKDQRIKAAQLRLNSLQPQPQQPMQVQPQPVLRLQQNTFAVNSSTASTTRSVPQNQYGNCSPQMLMIMAASQPGFAQGFLMRHQFGQQNQWQQQ